MEMAPCRHFIGVVLSIVSPERKKQPQQQKQTLTQNKKKFQDLSSGYFTSKEKHQ